MFPPFSHWWLLFSAEPFRAFFCLQEVGKGREQERKLCLQEVGNMYRMYSSRAMHRYMDVTE